MAAAVAVGVANQTDDDTNQLAVVPSAGLGTHEPAVSISAPEAGTTVVSRRDGSEHTFSASYTGFGASRAADEQAYETSFASGGFSLPREHCVTQDLRPGYDQVSVDTAISSSNRGFQLLQKMGWREKTALGRKGDGILEPVTMKFRTAGDTIGIGKDTEYDEMAETAAVERKKYLEVELNLTEEEKAARLEKHEAKEETQRVVVNNHKHFYCETCAKQFWNVDNFDEHMNSYGHHHKKRLMELKVMERQRGKDERLAREKKAAARQAEKDMARYAAATAKAEQARVAAAAVAAAVTVAETAEAVSTSTEEAISDAASVPVAAGALKLGSVPLKLGGLSSGLSAKGRRTDRVKRDRRGSGLRGKAGGIFSMGAEDSDSDGEAAAAAAGAGARKPSWKPGQHD
eukprot:COSAG02_NODE_2939_length_7699_cov_2.571184_2_plen_402_part_00